MRRLPNYIGVEALREWGEQPAARSRPMDLPTLPQIISSMLPQQYRGFPPHQLVGSIALYERETRYFYLMAWMKFQASLYVEDWRAG